MTEQQVRKMRRGAPWKPSSEQAIQDYINRRVANKERRRIRYEQRLNANVEPSVTRYANNLLSFIEGEGEGESSYIYHRLVLMY